MRAKLVLTALVVMALDALGLWAWMGSDAFHLWGIPALVLGALAVLVLLRVALVSVSRLLERITEIEIALLELSRGSRSAPIALRGDALDGLAHRVNLLVESQRIPSGAPSALPDLAATSPSAVAEEIATQISAEDEDVYLARTFDEYVAAKRALGEDVTGIDRARFTKGLIANAERTAKKLGCGRVRFHVRSEGGIVTLEPIAVA